jgi:hypothetical protein
MKVERYQSLMKAVRVIMSRYEINKLYTRQKFNCTTNIALYFGAEKVRVC